MTTQTPTRSPLPPVLRIILAQQIDEAVLLLGCMCNPRPGYGESLPTTVWRPLRDWADGKIAALLKDVEPLWSSPGGDPPDTATVAQASLIADACAANPDLTLQQAEAFVKLKWPRLAAQVRAETRERLEGKPLPALPTKEELEGMLQDAADAVREWRGP